MAADQPHFNADISMTNPPERRLLPERAIERFRRICCHSRWPSAGQSADHPSQSDPRRSAPRGNRCYLPADASPLIPSIVLNFLPEFVRHCNGDCEAPARLGHRSSPISTSPQEDSRTRRPRPRQTLPDGSVSWAA
jgi:hypothetical protein